MTDKLELKVGGQYKTRGGWRAVVVKHKSCSIYPFIIWNECGCEQIAHITESGLYYHKDECKGHSEYDLIAEWKEPEKIETVINMYRRKDGFIYIEDSKTTRSTDEVIGTKEFICEEGEFYF